MVAPAPGLHHVAFVQTGCDPHSGLQTSGGSSRNQASEGACPTKPPMRGKQTTNMRKIHLLGLALLAVCAFGAFAATAAMAELPNVEATNEKLLWLANGVNWGEGEVNALASETKGENRSNEVTLQ